MGAAEPMNVVGDDPSGCSRYCTSMLNELDGPVVGRVEEPITSAPCDTPAV